jgi:hypothetical protein
MTPDEIAALAAACERAAAIAYMFAGPPEYRTDMTEQAFRDAEAVRAHARALRDGRVTVSEEASRG